MEIKLPSMDEQKKIVKEKEKKIRTSFEFSEESLKMLEEEAEKRNIPPSEIMREIIETTHINTNNFQKRLKNVTVNQVHIDKLDEIGKKLVPEKWVGKRGVNRSAVAELLLKEYFNKLNSN